MLCLYVEKHFWALLDAIKYKKQTNNICLHLDTIIYLYIYICTKIFTYIQEKTGQAYSSVSWDLPIAPYWYLDY